jgi:transposase
MLYLGIDQHSKQFTVALLEETGNVILRRQISTQPEKAQAFLAELQQRGPFMAILEVCGFNDWLIEMLHQCKCQEVVLIHPERPSKRKTDRRDAHKLAEMLWLNRDRLIGGQKPKGIRRVVPANEQQQQERQLTTLRQRLTRKRTQVINRVKGILHRRNLMWECPTKTFQTKKVQLWLKELKLPRIDRFELDGLLAQWHMFNEQLNEVDSQIEERVISAKFDDPVQLLRTTGWLGAFGAMVIASRIGNIERFPTSRSLANYFGLTPSCHNSGKSGDRLGSITKEGSQIVRYVLGQAVLHILKKDKFMRQWYRKIKLRRGSKIARVAVMRKMCTIIWSMLKHKEGYYVGGPPRLHRERADSDLSSGSAKGDQQAVGAGG